MLLPHQESGVNCILSDEETGNKQSCDEKLIASPEFQEKEAKAEDADLIKDDNADKSARQWSYASVNHTIVANRDEPIVNSESVGSYPYVYIGLSLMISLCSLGMFKMVLRDRIRDGYTPVNAPSRYETSVMREFWNSSGDPMMTVVLVTAKDNGSMLRDNYINEACKLSRFLLENYTVDYKGRSYKYKDVCSPYCDMNAALEMFKAGLESEREIARKGRQLTARTTLSFPISTIAGLKVHLERVFFGVRKRTPVDKDFFVNNNITTMIKYQNITYSQLLSDIDSVEVILLLYRADKNDHQMEEILSLWELSLFDFFRNVYKDNLLDIQIIGTEILDQEMIKDGQRIMSYFAAGFGFMIIFVGASVLLSAVFYNTMDWGKVIVACGSILCPVLSIMTTYGIISLFGVRTNSFMLVMPYLIMGIGVDDGFLMIHAWHHAALYSNSVAERLGAVLEEVGPSMTVTSLTNFISFGFGALTPTPEIRLFCGATAIAMGLDYLFELILFGPILAVAATKEVRRVIRPSQNKPFLSLDWRLKINSCMSYILRIYCRLVCHRLFTIILTLFVAVYWYFAILGAFRIETKLDTVKILPKDSPIQTPNKLLNDIIWAEYHPVTVIVNNPLDIGDPKQLKHFWKLVKEFEDLPYCKGNLFTLLWIRDYARYFIHGEPIDVFLSILGLDDEEEPFVDPTAVTMNYSRLGDFLQSPFYKHWKAFIKLEKTENNVLRVKKFWFSVAYENMSTWKQRIEIMQLWRGIAYRYQDLNVTVWEANSMFIDQMLSLKSVAVQSGALTLICMAVVCTIFIPNPCSVITASITIASISLGVFGFLSWWNFDLDPVTTAAVLMSIGLSVDFTAHVSYHYQLTSKKELRHGRIVKIPLKGAQKKLEYTLETVGWPMIQAGASTVMCILPLLFLQSYAPMVFVKTIILVVSWGILHGLIVLPGILGALPDCLTNANCYRTFLSTSSQKSCRYTGSVKHEEHELQNHN